MLIKSIFDNHDDAVAYMKSLKDQSEVRRVYHVYCNGKHEVNVAYGDEKDEDEVRMLLGKREKELEL